MHNKSKKITSVVMVIILLLPHLIFLPSSKIMIAEGKELAKEYVIQMDDKESYYQLKEKFDIISSEEYLKDENIVVTELHESEAESLLDNPNVLSVEENINFYASAKSKELIGEKQQKYNDWNLQAIHMPYKEKTNYRTAKVAIIDSGVSYSSDIDVKERINFTDNLSENPIFDDCIGHGTSILGIIGAKNNETGISGIASDAELYSLKVMNEDNTTTLEQVVRSLYWCIENDINIVNMSFGCRSYSAILEKAIQDAYSAGILLIASSGNNGLQNQIDYPAAFDEVLSVGSINAENDITEDSNIDNCLELLAPGESVLSTFLYNSLAVVGGTSIATAHVTGAAAYLWETLPIANSKYIRQLLVASSNRICDSNVGILDIHHAIEMSADFSLDETVILTERNKVSYDITDILTGSWSQSNHSSTVNEATNIGIGSTNLSLMSQAAGSMDTLYGGNSSNFVGPLHGRNNYVANLHYLYNIALALKKNNASSPDLDTKAKIKSFIEKYVPTSSITVNGGTGKQKNNLETLHNAVIDYLTNQKNRTTIQKAWLVLGMAAHLLGDTFAHRTIVPTSEAENISEGTTALKRDILLGIVETRDLKAAEYGNLNTSRYEDSTTFLAARYSETINEVYYLAESLYNKADFEPYQIICPIEEFPEAGYKLNFFSGYVKQSGYAVDTEIKAVSTSTYQKSTYGVDDEGY